MTSQSNVQPPSNDDIQRIAESLFTHGWSDIAQLRKARGRKRRKLRHHPQCRHMAWKDRPIYLLDAKATATATTTADKTHVVE